MALSQKFAVKKKTGAIVHNFAVIFVDVVGNGKLELVVLNDSVNNIV